MKLIIQIPCYNESETLPITLKEMPKKVKGFDKVEWLIIDDGSTDRSLEIAKKYGVHHIVSLTKNQGLARVFMAGIEECLKQGADVIVTTDADNQYNIKDIDKLVRPIIEGKADIVIGSRPISTIKHFSSVKKILQRLGSWTVRVARRTNIEDAPSGFRAFSREAALHFNVFNNYTYTLETIIQAGRKNMAITSVPIRVNKDLRPSRLVKSIPNYIQRSIITIFRIFVVYKPFRFFVTLGIFLLILGFIPGLRFLYLLFTIGGSGHIQSLILSSILIIMGVQMVVLGFIGDLQAVNRSLIEDIQYRLRKMDSEKTRTKIKR